MALGIPGTGPYGSVRALRADINDCKYELRLISEGMRRPIGSKRLKEMIETNKAKIRAITAAVRAKKALGS